MSADGAARCRILVVDDNQLARMGIVAMIETDPSFVVVAVARDGVEGLERWRSERPDVTVVDLKMPRLDGVQLAAALAAESPPGRVLVLSQHEGDEDVFRALRAGALGYLTKDADGRELLEAIRKVASGQRYIPASIAAKLAERVALGELSLRELQVLGLLYEGQPNKEIAAALGISERTVATHVGRVLDKLDARNRTEAIAIALKRGILPGR